MEAQTIAIPLMGYRNIPDGFALTLERHCSYNPSALQANFFGSSTHAIRIE